MKSNRFNLHLGRTAVALTTALALALPGNSAVIGGQSAGHTVMDGGRAMYTTISATHDLRLDGVAASLMTRPVARLTSAERRDLADRYNDRIISSNTDLEALARSAEFAAVLAAGDVDEFVMVLSYLTLDATDNWTAIACRPAHPRAPTHSQPPPVVPGKRSVAPLRQRGVRGG